MLDSDMRMFWSSISAIHAPEPLGKPLRISSGVLFVGDHPESQLGAVLNSQLFEHDGEVFLNCPLGKMQLPRNLFVGQSPTHEGGHVSFTRRQWLAEMIGVRNFWFSTC